MSSQLLHGLAKLTRDVGGSRVLRRVRQVLANRRVRSSIIWLLLTTLMFACAAYLTISITRIEGHAAFTEADGKGEDIFVADPSRYSVAIYAKNANRAMARATSVSFVSAPFQTWARFSFSMPAEMQAIILLDNLASPRSCTSNRSTDDVMRSDLGQNMHVTIRPLKYGTTPLFAITPDSITPQERDASNNEIRVTCKVNSKPREITFVRRSVSFYDLKLMHWPAPDPDGADALAGYDPLPGLLLYVGGIGGAENIQFSGGFRPPDVMDYEFTRTIVPEMRVEVAWSDVYQEQFRDIILVVIGALIGIGVTMLIEVLRPIIDSE